MDIGDFFLIASGIYAGNCLTAMTLVWFYKYRNETDSANVPAISSFAAAFPMLIVLGTMLVYG